MAFGNRGKTSLKCRQRSANPMQDFDRLPPDLRDWVSNAALPWRAKSVQRAYGQALKRTGDHRLAMGELDRLQRKSIQKDARAVWGAGYPGS